MTHREMQLRYCKKCKNREFNKKKGLVCQLTGDVADFYKVCSQYIVDEEKVEEIKQIKVKEELQVIESETDRTVKMLFLFSIATIFFGSFFLFYSKVIIEFSISVLFLGILFLAVSFYSLRDTLKAFKIGMVFILPLIISLLLVFRLLFALDIPDIFEYYLAIMAFSLVSGFFSEKRKRKLLQEM